MVSFYRIEIHAGVVFSFPVLAPVDFNGFLIQDIEVTDCYWTRSFLSFMQMCH